MTRPCERVSALPKSVACFVTRFPHGQAARVGEAWAQRGWQGHCPPQDTTDSHHGCAVSSRTKPSQTEGNEAING